MKAVQTAGVIPEEKRKRMVQADPDHLDQCSTEEIRKILKKEQRRLRLQKFYRNKLAVLGFTILMIVVLGAVFAPLLTKYGPYDMEVVNRLKGPSAEHIFGTDTFGRDLLTRILYGARISLVIGLATSVLALVVGMVCGLYASYYKPLDNVLMRICDGLSAVPASLLAIAFMAVLGASVKNVVISIPRFDIKSCNWDFKFSSILIVTFVFAIISLLPLLLLYSSFLLLSIHCYNIAHKVII